MPVLTQGESNMPILPADYSASAIERRFTAISSIEVAGVQSHLYWDESTLVASIISNESNANGRYPVIASLELESTEWKEKNSFAVERFWQQDPSQVRGVVVEPKLRDFGLATFIYETLAIDMGMVLVSDNEQYEGGKALWKKIARDSDRLKVYVLDSSTFDFHPYGEDGRTVYTGSNIDDEELWSIDPDDSKFDIVFVAEPVAAAS
ncbi:hypothetical protein NTE12_003687 [Vibrio harveyi]|uniref:hypothetical protein n=1 Tax=Vibrio harveyi TaxID=669 RepID=UPI003AAAF356|nr:hypothetical protein [Vibrio harveyi]